MKKQIITLILAILLVSTVSAVLDLQVNAKLNHHNTDFYALTNANANAGYDGYDFASQPINSNESRLFSWCNYSAFPQTLTQDNCTLAIDSWNDEDRTLYLVYRVAPLTSGDLNISWNSSFLGARYNAIFKDYGSDRTYTTAISSDIDMEENQSYTSNSSDYLSAIGSGWRFLTLTIDYIPPSSGGCTPDTSCASSTCVGDTCDDGCDGVVSGTLSPDCSGLECGVSPNGCGTCGTCSSGFECQSGTCIELPDCTIDSDCPSGFECQSGTCVEEELPLNDTPSDIPQSLQDLSSSLGCTYDFSCQEWSSCTGDYNVDQLINQEAIEGYRTRLCLDKNNCLSSFVENKSCSLKDEVIVQEKEWCGEIYIELIDKFTGEVLSRLKKDSAESLDVRINLVGEGYCENCFNGIQDADEEGVDCGGSCIDCMEEIPSKVRIILPLEFWLWLSALVVLVGAFVGNTVSTVLGLKKVESSEADKLLRKYRRWRKQGYDVGVLDKDVKALK